MTIRAGARTYCGMRSLPRLAAALVVALVAAPALAQEDEGDPVAEPEVAAAADSAAVAADSLAEEAESAGEPAPEVAHVVPSLEGLAKVAISYRDMVPAAPGAETQVEIWRGAAGQVLRFVTGGTAWAVVVRPPGGSGAYTLRDRDCSGAFAEDVAAGTPLEVPACATSGGAAGSDADEDEDDDDD